MKYVLAVLCVVVAGLPVVAACGGAETASQVSAVPQIAPSQAPAPVVDQEARLRAAVRRYADVFLHGRAKAAWLMRTDHANAGLSYAEFRMGVMLAKDIYGDATMTSLKVIRLDGARAVVTYRFDLPDIDQVREPWRLVGGAWMNDGQ